MATTLNTGAPCVLLNVWLCTLRIPLVQEERPIVYVVTLLAHSVNYSIGYFLPAQSDFKEIIGSHGNNQTNPKLATVYVSQIVARFPYQCENSVVSSLFAHVSLLFKFSLSKNLKCYN